MSIDELIDEKAFKKLKRVLCGDGTLQTWSDGSYINDRMGHGYMIRTKYYYDDTMITGWGKSIDGSVKSSLRAEHCGAISILILILIIEKLRIQKQEE